MQTLTADVVVLGTGPAGMAATAAARETGATVIAVEARDAIGGNAVFSNGYLTFVGSEIQNGHGIGDDEESFVSDARRAFEAARDRFGVVWNEDVVRLFARESAQTYRILTGRGVRFTRLVPRPEHSIDRILAVAEPMMFSRAFAPDFASPTVRTLYSTVVDRLITDGGRVTGVRARRLAGNPDDHQQVQLRADRGVVLATGGYQSNPALRRRFQTEFAAHTPYLGIDTCRGTGHLIGQSVGGDLVNMTFVPPMVVVTSTVVENSIAVNDAGSRFHDETGPNDERVEQLRAQPGRRAWYVLDDVAAGEYAGLIEQMPEPAVRANTLIELATLLAIPPDALQRTLARWNDFLNSAADVDPEFGRRALPAGRRTCASGPFHAVPMVEGINFSCGGFRTTARMQVLDVFGDPIPGLFAAGDCASGLNSAADMGGLRICGGLTLGRIAGQSAARHTDDRINHGSVLHAGPAHTVDTGRDSPSTRSSPGGQARLFAHDTR